MNWQGIHICTQQESFITVSDSGKDTAVTDALRLIAHLFQLLTDVGRGLGQVQSQFGVLVEPAAMADEEDFSPSHLEQCSITKQYENVVLEDCLREIIQEIVRICGEGR